MAYQEHFTCQCGTRKQTTNHWILAKITDAGVVFFKWDTDRAKRDDVYTLCGERCAGILLSRELSDWKTYAYPVPELELVEA